MTDLQLPGVDRPLGRVVLGTMTFGDTADERAAAAMIEAFLAAGGTGIDTANGYAGGRSEEMLGRLLAGRRDDVVLATKVGIPNPDAGGAAPLSRVAIERCVLASLERLDTDHVDLLYLHQPDRATPIEETIAAVGHLVERGRVRAWGVSNYAAWRIERLRWVADRIGVPQPVIAQQLYSAIATRLDDEYADFAVETRLPTVVYNPLGGGLLTGRLSAADPQEGMEGRFGSSVLAGMYRARYWNDTVFETIERLRAVADGAGLPLVELALRFVLSRPVVDAVLIGGSRPANIEANLVALARGPLDEDVVAAVLDAAATVRGVMPAYNR